MISCQGKHNRTKVLCFIQMNGPWLQSGQLAMILDSSPACLRTLLSRWAKWGYVVLKLDSEGTRSYTLSHKGFNWLSKHWREFPLGRWVSELPPDKQDCFQFLFKQEEQ